MRKFIIIMAMVVATGVTTQAREKGGFIGGLHGCCFGIRGAAAYNDGKEFTGLEWVDALLTGHIIAFIKGWSGQTTEDLRRIHGSAFY